MLRQRCGNNGVERMCGAGVVNVVAYDAASMTDNPPAPIPIHDKERGREVGNAREKRLT